MPRPNPALAVALAALIAAPVAAGAQDREARQMTEAGARVRDAWPETRERLLEGDVPGAVASMRNATRRDGWLGKLTVGNMIWVMHPAESRTLHEEALAESKGSSKVRLEMALHHTRANECDAALADWQALRGDANIPPHMALIEAYCHLRKGDDAAAVAAFDRPVQTTRHGMATYVGLVDELWGPKPAIAVYADRMGLYRSGDPGTTLDALIQAAAEVDDFETRWEALQRVADAAAAREGAQSPRAAELACLRPWLADEEARAAKAASDDELFSPEDTGYSRRQDAAFKRCGILVAGQALPANLGLARAALHWMISDGADPKALLAQHGPALKARAEAAPGEPFALEVLAGLQSKAGDWDGVAASDALGWRRYGLPKFAESRVLGLFVGDIEREKAPSASTLALLDEARGQFPDSALLLWLDVMSQRSTGDARRVLVRQWLLAEHRTPAETDAMHFTPSNSRLMDAWRTWRQLQDAR